MDFMGDPLRFPSLAAAGCEGKDHLRTPSASRKNQSPASLGLPQIRETALDSHAMNARTILTISPG
jgi:hypothetical protein